MKYELLSILVVDDNHYFRIMLITILRALGVQTIYEAGDGAAGLQVLRDHDVDIVMTDLTMEPLDGIDFVRLLRNSPESTNRMVPVIMVTAHTTWNRITASRDAGVNEFLAKPVTAKGVIDRLYKCVEEPRPFVRSESYFGPDRRRKSDAKFNGPFRRVSDTQPGGPAYDPNNRAPHA